MNVMKEVEITVINDGSKHDNGPISNDEPDVAEPPEKAVAKDTSAFRKPLPTQWGIAPKLPIMTQTFQHPTHLPGEADPTSVPLPTSREENQRI